MLRKIVFTLILAFIIIQFIKPAKNQSTDHSKDITTVVTVPENVHAILQKACYDCHSNNTNYPWFDQIQPVMWWVTHHINEGKEHLNFSEFATYSTKKQTKKIDEIGDVVSDDEMPLESYTLMHKEARLTPEEKDLISNWAADVVRARDEAADENAK